MKKLFLLLLIPMLMMCNKKPQPVPVITWEKYDDIYNKISFHKPQGWPVTQIDAQISIYSSAEAVNRFIDLGGGGKDAARMVVVALKMDSLQTVEQYLQHVQAGLDASGYNTGAAIDDRLAGLPAKAFQYNGSIDQKNRLFASRFVAVQDSMLYDVSFEALNNLFTSDKFVFDSLLQSIRIPQPQSKKEPEDLVTPSTTFIRFTNESLSISYPDNFETTTPPPKAPSVFTLDIRGYRQDSFIHLDIMPAQKLSYDKILQQNAKYYQEISRGNTNIDGLAVTFLNYSPVRDINSRVYFLLKNDKIYRVILNYYRPMKDKYLAPFEKTISTLKIN